jgi:DNA polymerase elongation subunit (family B)
METHRLFTYSWHIDPLVADEITRIRVYGINEQNENVCLQIDDFTPYIYLELPTHIQWDGTNAQMLGERIDSIMKDARPVSKKLRWMKKLYGAHIKNGKRQLFPYLFCSFSTVEDIRTMNMKCRNIHVNNLGQLRLPIHEQVADPILQLVSCRNIPTAGWIECRGKRVEGDAKITRCDHELYVQWKNIKPWTSDLTANPLIMGYDIEANSSNPARMPLASEPEDKIFQVSCVFSRHGESPDKWRSYLLTLGNPRQDIVGATVIIHTFKTEAQLLQGFTELVNTENPNIMAGYNILGFDIRYMVDRAQHTMCFPDFDKQGFLKDTHCIDTPLRGPATDKSKNEYNFLATEGRVSVDLMWLVKRDYKLDNYQLKTISKHFLGKKHQKDPLDHHGIFKCYAEGIKKRNGKFTRKAQRAMGIVGKYCCQDSALVVRLMDHLQTWIGLTQMATICNIPIFPLYTEGQQVRVYSQVYKYAMYDNTVVEKDGYIPKDTERYVGAYVFDPVPGCYDVVVPLDFKSLYPCTMIAYNIDYSTLVSDPDVPDEDCHCMVWEDHVGCCITGDTAISLNGLSTSLINLEHNHETILSFDQKNLVLTKSTKEAFYHQGNRECIKITLEDGTNLVCTPDHKILTSENNWVEADQLLNQRVKTGPTFPEFDMLKEIADYGEWMYSFESQATIPCTSPGRAFQCFQRNKIALARTLRLNTINEYTTSVSIARLIGYLITDGTVNTANNRCVLFIGHPIDVETIQKDVLYVCGEILAVTQQQYCWSVGIPHNLSIWLKNLPGVVSGKRTTQPHVLPGFIIADDCPRPVVREFLSGMFSGDGCTIAISDSFGSVGFVQSSEPDHIEDLLTMMNQIKHLLEKFGVESSIMTPQTRIDSCASILVNLRIRTHSIRQFAETIGFRYCIHKSIRLWAIVSYIKFRDEVSRQRNSVIQRASELRGAPTVTRKPLSNNPDPCDLNSDLQDTLVKIKNCSSRERRARDVSNSTLKRGGNTQRGITLKEAVSQSMRHSYFPSVVTYLHSIGANGLFSNGSGKSTYAFPIGQGIPTLNLKIVSIRPVGVKQVFDIGVASTHNFIANGIIVHNCHDPKVVRCNEITVIVDAERVKRRAMCTERDSMKCKDYARIGMSQAQIRAARDEAQADLNKKIKAIDRFIKPFTEERQELKKGKCKKERIMCEKRSYRWLKEPKGILPTILEELMGARTRTRTEMKQNKKRIDEIGKSDEADHLKGLNLVLEQRQLSYKICANSVAGPTPIPCHIDGSLVYRTIEEISLGDWIPINATQEISTPIKGLSVWSDTGFTSVKHIMRHPQDEPLHRVNTHTGVVDCTADHSLLASNGVEVSPAQLSIGSELMHRSAPLPIDSPDQPLYRALSRTTIQEHSLNDRDEEMAFVHGLFFAEGTCGTWGNLTNTKSSWVIYNQDKELLERALAILNKYEGAFTISPYYDSASTYHLRCVGKVKPFCDKYRQLFYDIRRYKRVPDYLLDAPLNVRQAFFVGYYAGDGNRHLKVGIVINNKGQIGSAALMFLAQSLGYLVSVSVHKDTDIYRLQCSTKFRIQNHCSVKRIETGCNYPLIKPLRPDIVRNGERILYRNGTASYRQIVIVASRLPRQSLLDTLDVVITAAQRRGTRIIKYHTESKRITYVTNCCQMEGYISLKALKKDQPARPICRCVEIPTDMSANTPKLHVECQENQEYVYDIETENHHFAAGVGHLIVHNSVYGALGVRGTRYLPLMPAAMCTTYMGRVNIKIAANAIKETYGGEIVYGDTDSCLVRFPSHVTSETAWDYATYVAAEVTKLYPRPLELEFEQLIYWRFLILAKKQYMYYSCDRDGIIDEDLGKKGVVLARRDNNTFVRDIYRKVVSMVLECKPRDDIIYLITENVKGLFGRSNPHKNFVITQSIKSIGDRIAEPFIDEDGKKKGRFGDYKVALLPIKTKERELALHKKGVDTAEEYYIKTLPAAVQLAERMKKRGQRAEPGSRLEFVVLPSKVSDKVCDKVESSEYFLKHAEVLDLDLFYYLEKLATPLDKVLDVVYGKDPDFKKNMVLSLLKQSKLKAKMIEEFKSFTQPEIIF